MLRRTLLTVAVLLLFPVPATAATLDVTTPSGTRETVDLAGLEPDVVDATYGDERLTGVSLARALQDAGVGRIDAGPVTVGSLTLDRAAAFPAEGSPQPVLVTAGEALRLVVPGGRSAAAPDGRLAITVAAPAPGDDSADDEFALTVTPRRPDPGQRVRIAVAAPVAGATYSWRVDDRAVAGETSVTRTFRTAGRYVVEVFQTGTSRFGGARIVVGDPKPPDDEDGAATTPTPGPRSAEGGTSAGDGPGGAAAPPSAGATVPPAASADRPTPAPSASPSPAPTPAPSGQRVEGELLDGAVAVAQAVPASEVAAAGEDDGGGFRLPTGVWVAGAVLVLAWFGWGLDMLRARPRWS